jgi:antitoxin HigA-1
MNRELQGASVAGIFAAMWDGSGRMRDALNPAIGCAPRSPASVLREYLLSLQATQAELARASGVSPVRVNLILRGRGRVRAEMALRLGRVLGTGPEFWIKLQNEIDLQRATERLGDRLYKLPILGSHEKVAAIQQKPRSSRQAHDTHLLVRDEGIRDRLDDRRDPGAGSGNGPLRVAESAKEQVW